jgi:hypothetical protein
MVLTPYGKVALICARLVIGELESPRQRSRDSL